MSALWAWFLDVMCGPKCKMGCGYRARGWRSYQAHMWTEHADVEMPS